MSDYLKTSLDTDSPEFQGSVARGILGSIVGMVVCILVLLLCWLVDFQSTMLLFHLFIGTVIGWFYRLFHGRRQACHLYHCGRLYHADLPALDAGAGSGSFER